MGQKIWPIIYKVSKKTNCLIDLPPVLDTRLS
ncbi:Uncharacterised protein [Klebsiella pneumoniae]|nr:Uncharacterised protein [Klebsiella pneumoniae]